MKNFSVLRVKPMTGSDLKAADSHQMRRHNELHIDTGRSTLNRIILGSGDINADANAIIDRYPLANKSTTAVAAEMILTAHHEYFDRISPKWREGEFTPKLEKWIKDSSDWMKKKYGSGVASITLHLDETAVHIHAVIVPISTYEIKFRRGSKEVTRINYRHIFADPIQVINKARRENRSDTDTKLGRLQTDYADAVASLDLLRGIRNSKATHKEVREYQRMLKAPTPVLKTLTTKAKPDHPDREVTFVLPPVPGIFSRTEEGIKAAMLNSAKLSIQVNQKANNEAISIAMRKAAAHDNAVADNERLKTLVVEKDIKMVEMQNSITKLNDELELTKIEIASLRGIDCTRVADALSYTGPITWRNAIDMVKQLEGMDYKSSVAWLYNEFGLEAAAGVAADAEANAVKRYIAQNPPVPLTKQQRVKAQAVTEQLAALGASHYRITMMSSTNPTYNAGKGKGQDGEEKLYTAPEVVAMIPQLERKNMREQYNVFVTPLDEKQSFILLDDLTPKSLQDMRNAGYQPNVLLESSKDSMQAVFTVEKDAVTKGVGNAVFKELNAMYGDPNIQGYVHPFRLAGFANVKDKHRDPVTQKYPFVRMIQQVKGVCKKLMEFVQHITAETSKPRIDDAKASDSVRAVLMSSEGVKGATGHSDPVPEPLRQMADSHYRWCMHRYGDNMNRSVADFMLVKKAIAKGYGNADIVGALLMNSPDLMDRHPDVSRYLTDTIEAAEKEVSPPPSSEHDSDHKP